MSVLSNSGLAGGRNFVLCECQGPKSEAGYYRDKRHESFQQHGQSAFRERETLGINLVGTDRGSLRKVPPQGSIRLRARVDNERSNPVAFVPWWQGGQPLNGAKDASGQMRPAIGTTQASQFTRGVAFQRPNDRHFRQGLPFLLN